MSTARKVHSNHFVRLAKPRSSFPGGSAVKNSAASAGEMVSIPGSGRFPGEGNGYLLQYSCLEIPYTEESGRR